MNDNQQMSIFDFLEIGGVDKCSIDKPIRLIENFAGIGATAKALERLGVNFEHYKISEWEVHATASYHMIHMKDDKTDYSAAFTDKELVDKLFELGVSVDGKKPMSHTKIKGKGEKWHRRVYNDFIATHNIGSITNLSAKDYEIVDKDKYCYLFTYSSPCQDLSIAGKQKGMEKGSGTRSGLLWEIERILLELKDNNSLPDILLLENVPAIHSKKFMPDFRKWIDALEDLGYTNFWQDMNAKDYGVAQSRNRTFMVSILQQNVNFEFPKPITLDKKMRDYLEDSVETKYYINNEKSQKLIDELISSGTILDRQTDRQTDSNSARQGNNIEKENRCCDNINGKRLQGISQSGQQRSNRNESLRVGCLDSGTGAHQSNQVIDENGLATCLYAGQHKNPLKFIHREN